MSAWWGELQKLRRPPNWFLRNAVVCSSCLDGRRVLGRSSSTPRNCCSVRGMEVWVSHRCLRNASCSAHVSAISRGDRTQHLFQKRYSSWFAWIGRPSGDNARTSIILHPHNMSSSMSAVKITLMHVAFFSDVSSVPCKRISLLRLLHQRPRCVVGL